MNVDEDIRPVYFTEEDNVIEELYAPLLQNSVEYVRAAGFFRSSVFRLMTEDLLDFAIRGGKMTLITSIHVDKEDYASVMSNLNREIIVEELKEMRENPDLIASTDMLAALVCYGALEIKIGIRKTGIYHKKKGYFRDSHGHTILFHGSGNETLSALNPDIDEGSAEEFSIYRNWISDTWTSHGKPHFEKLNREMIGDCIPNTPIISIEKVDPEFFDFIEGDDWIDLEKHRQHSKQRKEQMSQLWDEHFATIKLRDHQTRGIAAWKQNGYRGILAHATGSGKTFTAMNCIKEHVESGYPALVIVPSEILLNQWIEEIKDTKMGVIDCDILPAGGGHNKWRKNLHLYLDRRKSERKRIVVAIIHTAKLSSFIQCLPKLDNTLVVVDECHRIGMPSCQDLVTITPGRVLGLSATPTRYGDPEGEARVFQYCGEIVDTYSLADGIKDGHLCNYEYSIETVGLTATEEQDYSERMAEISRLFARAREDPNTGQKVISPYLKNMLIQAKAIIKTADEKIDSTAEIIRNNFSINEKQWWLIYCQDNNQLREVKEAIQPVTDAMVFEYWSGAEGATHNGKKESFDRDTTKRMFEDLGGILLAIHCFDEGVNIECISHGIILASSKNPRQFIQRRGRMLRKTKTKKIARIWDTVVVPKSMSGHTNYVLDELDRAWEFSEYAVNSQAQTKLNTIRFDLGIANRQPIWVGGNEDNDDGD